LRVIRSRSRSTGCVRIVSLVRLVTVMFTAQPKNAAVVRANAADSRLRRRGRGGAARRGWGEGRFQASFVRLAISRSRSSITALMSAGCILATSLSVLTCKAH
jgi:hypothetical protein